MTTVESAPSTAVSGSVADPAASVRAPAGGRLPYLPGLDGVRALAVAAVLLFHLPARVMPGGFLGVDLFFVLSGFLITSLLLEEMARTRTVGFKAFYVRRARRLLPALFAMLALTSVLVLVVANDAAAQFRQDALAALTYSTNWWYIVDARSYFELMGRPPMLHHLWSLAVEEQFYLVWPLLAFVAWKLRGRRGVAVVAVVGAVVSTLWMAWVSVRSGVPAVADSTRVYFGFDTHAMTIMVGAALATVWRPARLDPWLSSRAQRTLGAAGVVSIVWLLSFFFLVDATTPWLYRGGFLVMALLSLPLLVAASHPGSTFGVVLGMPVLRWLGTRSYGIYLYHWPIFLVTRPDLDLPYGGWAAASTSLALTFAVAELSYRYLEMPVRRGAVGRAWRSLRVGSQQVRVAYGAAALGATVTLVAGCAALAAVPAVDASTYLGGATAVGAGTLQPKAAPTGGNAPSGRSTTSPSVPSDQPIALRTQRITAVGDSVLLGARAAIKDEMPRTTIDATISRQPAELIARVEERARLGRLAPVLVIHTGTNGIPSASDLRSLLEGLSGLRRVVLVNIHAPVPWAEQSNRALETAARGLPNVAIADWAKASDGQRGYFYPDGTHLTPRGAAAFARTIGDAIERPLPAAAGQQPTGSTTSPTGSPAESASPTTG